MKRLLVCLVVGFCILSFSSVCLAQGAPLFSSAFSDRIAKAFTWGDGEFPKIKPLKVSVGWAESRKGLVLCWNLFDTSTEFTGALRGLYIEGTQQIRIENNLSLSLSAAALFPENNEGDTGFWGGFVTSETAFETQNTELWNLGCHAVYSGLPVDILGGFRWMQLQVETVEDVSAFVAPTSAFPYVGNNKLNAYIPLAGVRVQYSGLSLQAAGFPWVPSEYSYSTISGDWDSSDGLAMAKRERFTFPAKSSFFFEITADYRTQIYRDMAFGLFGKFSSFQGSFTGTLLTLDPDDNTFSDAIPLDASLHLTHWTFGGNVSIPFRSPI